MDDRQAYLSHLDEQLQVLESQVSGVREKMGQATAEGKTAMAELVERWPEALLKARRRIAEVKQEGESWTESRAEMDRMWDELHSLVDDAKAAY